MHRQRGAVSRFLRDRVREAMDAGVVAEGDPDGAALTLWSMLHGLASLHQAGMTRMEWLRERALTYLIEGIRIPEGIRHGTITCVNRDLIARKIRWKVRNNLRPHSAFCGDMGHPRLSGYSAGTPGITSAPARLGKRS